MDNLNMGNSTKQSKKPAPPSRRILQQWCMELEERVEKLEEKVKDDD